MSHLTDLQMSMWADEAILGEEAGQIEAHLRDCTDCQARMSLLQQESALIASSLDVTDPVMLPATMPRFRKRLGLREFALVNIATGVIVWLAQFIWKTLFGELVINALSWFSLPVPDFFALATDAVLHYVMEGTTMIETYVLAIVLLVSLVLITWALVRHHAARFLSITGALALVVGLTLAPTPASALEVIRSEAMTGIDAGQTVDDSVIIMGETIVVDGDVTGNAILMGRRIIVNGDIGGLLITLGESITINNETGGSLLSAGSDLELVDTRVGGDYWGFGNNILIDDASSVRGNALNIAESIIVGGLVGKDLYAFSQSVEVSGEVGRNLEAFVAMVRLLDGANIGGALRFRTDNEDNLQRASNAIVTGGVEFVGMPEEFDRRSRFEKGEFYLWQLVRLISAFIVGLAVLWLIPLLRDVNLESGVGALKTTGIGLVTLVSVPVIMMLFAVTIVGIPVTVIGITCWLLLIYLAKIVIASYIGQQLLDSTDYRDNLPVTLLAGLIVVIVAINIPALGGVINFLMTIVGIGLIVQLLMGYIRDS